MKYIKKIILILLVFSLPFGMSACKSSPNSQTADSKKTVTYIDCVGRKVTLPAKITRIAAIDSFSAEEMVMIGAGDEMVACPNGTQTDVLLAQIYPKLKDVAVVQSNGTVNAEALLALHPDVVLLKYAMYITDGEVEKLEKLHIPYLVISYTTMQEQIDAIRLIGEVAGSVPEQKADQICDYYDNCISRVKKIATAIPASKKVSVYHSINQTTCTDGKNSIGADWISAVGCIDCSVGNVLMAERDNYFASEEQIFVWNPDVIICNDASTRKYMLSDKGWNGLAAVSGKRIYQVPIGATRWGQPGSVETFFGMLWLGTTVYPNYYKTIHLRNEVFSFYSKILGIHLNNDMYQKIISGEGLRVGSQNAGK